MYWNSINAMLAQAPEPAMQPNPKAQTFSGIFMVVMMIVMMYVLMIRPKQKQERELNELLKTVRPGQEVITTSGIVGIVVSVKDDRIALRSAESKLEVLKSAIARVSDSGNKASKS